MDRSCVVVMMLAWGCGSVATTEIDAGDDPPIDGAGGPACDVAAPFGAPEPMTTLNTAGNEEALALSPDRRTAYFASNRGGGPGDYDLYTATRSSVDAPFGAPSVMPNVSTADREYSPVLTPDGLTLYFGRRPVAGGVYRVYAATRTSTSTAFGAAELVLNVNDDPSHTLPTDVNATGTRLYLSGTRGGDWDIYVATRTDTTGPFGAATPIRSLNVAAIEDYGAVLTGDELTVYFESRRDGAVGCYDVFVATRSTTADGFGDPTPVAALATDLCEYPSWVSADGCHIALVSDRTGTVGGFDLWIASKPPVP
jgi:hypothetical protein